VRRGGLIATGVSDVGLIVEGTNRAKTEIELLRKELGKR
jgi:hypothetical protein